MDNYVVTVIAVGNAEEVEGLKTAMTVLLDVKGWGYSVSVESFADLIEGP